MDKFYYVRPAIIVKWSIVYPLIFRGNSLWYDFVRRSVIIDHFNFEWKIIPIHEIVNNCMEIILYYYTITKAENYKNIIDLKNLFHFELKRLG